MISAESQRNHAGLKRLDHQLRMLGAGRGNFFQILRVGVAFFFLLRDGHSNVTAIFNLMPQRLETNASEFPLPRVRLKAPMSTPRRDCPRSSGTPITRIFLGEMLVVLIVVI